jgi:hypothetical protein
VKQAKESTFDHPKEKTLVIRRMAGTIWVIEISKKKFLQDWW